ncbi:homocysteine S-methyltransferase family protein [bacterium]|nr:homocysteine S-methyltransferase family protein [bacterium]
MSSIHALLAERPVLVGDGAMGSMLMKRGLQKGSCPELMNRTHPEVLERIAAEYLAAGADIIETNTFGGSPLKLAGYGLDSETEQLNGEAVVCARRAGGGRALIAGSCGPTGHMLIPYGTVEPETMLHGFRRQIGALAEAGADLICIETMTDIKEACLALQAAAETAPGLPRIATMTFDKTASGYVTIMGVPVARAAERLTASGADVLGSNCGNGIDAMIEIATAFREHTSLPLLIQANAGKPELRGTEVVYPESPDYFAQRVPQLIAAGASIIGGCCGTTPEHITAIRAAVDRALGRKGAHPA